MGKKYLDENGNLLYEEGKGGNLALVIFNGKGSLDGGIHMSDEVAVSINPAGLTNLGKEDILRVAKLKLECMGYSHLELTRGENVVPAEDWGRRH